MTNEIYERFDGLTLDCDRESCTIAFFDCERIKISVSSDVDTRMSRIGTDWVFINPESTEACVYINTNTVEGKTLSFIDGMVADDEYFLTSTAYDVPAKELYELALHIGKKILPKGIKITLSFMPIHEDELDLFYSCSRYLLGAYQ